ncbi:MAG: hypothetical protein RBT70_09575 [Alphaproteobacteria bacterium]|jgi:hypothetical protein|nr:hypothetical protein [Alphaproteobacteria bacterium]
MSRCLISLLVVSFLILSGAQQAPAQTLMEQGVVGSIGAGALYGASRGLRNPADGDPIAKQLEQQGFANVTPVPTNPSLYRAFFPAKGPVLIKVDPATGKVLSVDMK